MAVITGIKYLVKEKYKQVYKYQEYAIPGKREMNVSQRLIEMKCAEMHFPEGTVTQHLSLVPVSQVTQTYIQPGNSLKSYCTTHLCNLCVHKQTQREA